MVEAKKAVKKVTKTQPKAVKPAKKAVAKTTALKTEKVESTVAEAKGNKGSLTVASFDTTGKEAGTVKLPEVVFGAKINPVLMAQAVRVYLVNQRLGSASTKTRGQVDGSTRKIYRQKGTGRARHGGIRAPIFVGGGIAHGPKSKDFELTLPVKMKRAALASALSEMAKNGKIKVVTGFEKLEPKTKIVAGALNTMGLQKAKVLFVMPKYQENVFKAVRNIAKTIISDANVLTTYDVLNAGTLVLMEESLTALEKRLSKGKGEA